MVVYKSKKNCFAKFWLCQGMSIKICTHFVNHLDFYMKAVDESKDICKHIIILLARILSCFKEIIAHPREMLIILVYCSSVHFA